MRKVAMLWDDERRGAMKCQGRWRAIALLTVVVLVISTTMSSVVFTPTVAYSIGQGNCQVDDDTKTCKRSGAPPALMTTVSEGVAGK